MSLFDKFKGKNSEAQIPDKPMEEMTDDELRQACFRSDGVLQYRYMKEEFRRGMRTLWPDSLGRMAFLGMNHETPLEVDLPLAEVCARSVLRGNFEHKYDDDFFYKYVMGYFPKNSYSNRYAYPTYCFTPDFDALEKDFPCIINATKKRYDDKKHEYVRKGISGLPNHGFEQALILDEIRNLRRVGYDKIEYTPNNVVSFFRDLAEKGDPTGQFWYARCCEDEYVKELDPEDANTWLTKSAEQGYLMALYEYGRFKYDKEELRNEHKELVQAIDEYIETVECTDQTESFGRFMAKKNAAFAEAAQKEADIARASALYQSGLALFALGERDKSYDAMLESAELGNLPAYEWLVRLFAEEGNALAQYQLGELYLAGTEVTPKNPTLAFPWLVKAANGNIMDAYWRIGELYRMAAHGFDQNGEVAAAMYGKAAEGKHKPSMLLYAERCEAQEAKAVYRKLIKLCGDSLADRNYKLEAYRRLSTLDPADGETSVWAAAQFVLMHFDSTETMDYAGKTPEDAVKSVFAGDAYTARCIGLAVNYSKTINDAEKAARVWFRLAADMYMESAAHGDVKAIEQLFYIYCDNLKDEGKACYWGTKGMEKGSAAMYFAAADHPDIFNLDHEEVIAYLKIAADKGYEAAKQELLWWNNLERNEQERRRKVQRILDEQEEHRRSRKEWELSTRLDDLERMGNALLFGQFFTDEERAMMGELSVMDSIRSANLRDEVMRSLMKKQ